MTPYEPINDAESQQFRDAWCGKCRRGGGNFCDIASRAMRSDADDPDYPTEWTYAHDGSPCCLAFETMGDGPINDARQRSLLP